MNPVHCILTPQGWCGLTPNRKVTRHVTTVKTRCERIVTEWDGYAKRFPTCRDCLRSYRLATRKRINAVSKRNSRPWEDKDLRTRYMAANLYDELERVLSLHQPVEWLGRLAPHHIFHVGKCRWDLWSNLISVSRSTHDWIHANPPDGTILCLYHKYLVKREFNATEFAQASGYATLEGWLITHVPKQDWFVEYWAKLCDFAGTTLG